MDVEVKDVESIVEGFEARWSQSGSLDQATDNPEGWKKDLSNTLHSYAERLVENMIERFETHGIAYLQTLKDLRKSTLKAKE